MNKNTQGREESNLVDFCLFVARLYQNNPSEVDGVLLAQLASRLLAAESRPGGPYFGPEKTLDFPTNLAIGYLFTVFKKPLPNVTAFIQSQRSAGPHSPTIQALLKKYDALQRTAPHPSNPHTAEHMAIFSVARRHLGQLPQPERTTALSFLEKIYQADKSQEIALLPAFFASSLTSQPSSLPIQQLGLANIYCWIAYSIYDKLLDDEPSAQFLPAANITMRKSLQAYQELLPPNHPFQNTIQATYANMDHANAWELAYARFKRVGEDSVISQLPHYGRYQILADRCSGHILGALTVATLCDVSWDAFRHLEKGFRHYLIARQLSDDIHDWKDDFTAGHASSIVTYLLQQLHTQPGIYSSDILFKAMQTNFWHSSMENITAIIVRHLHYSRRYLLRSGLLQKNAPLFALHSRLETIAKTSLSQHHSSQAFLDAYKSTANGSRPLPQSPQP